MRELSEGFLDGAWRELEERAEDEPKWVSIRLPESPVERELLLALDERRRRHLLVPAETTNYPTNTASPLSVTVGTHEFAFTSNKDARGIYLDISCQLTKLNNQFDGVVESVIESIEGATDPARRAISTVSSWRKLFSSMADAPSLSTPEKLAAFGELSVLEHLLLNWEDFKAEWWGGPEKKPHDFTLDEYSIEVKSIGRDSRTVTMHGTHQLEAASKPLFLLILLVEESADGQTVGELLESLANLTADGTELRNRAAAIGVFSRSDDSTKFRVAEASLARVDEEFPRITAEILPDSVNEALLALKYELKIEKLRPFLQYIPLPRLKDAIDDLR